MALLKFLLMVPWLVVGPGVVCLPFLLAALPFALVKRGTRERYVWWTNSASSYLILKVVFLCRFDIRGRERLPRDRGYLVIANHRSWIDVLTLIWSARAEGISKDMVKYIPVLGQLGYLGGAVFFDRADPESRKRAKEESLFLLKQGVPLHLYPEGTRSRDGSLRGKTYLTLVEACFEHGIPVVPCALAGTEKVIPVNLIDGFGFGKTIHGRFGEPMEPADHPDAAAFAKAAWGQVERMLPELERHVADASS